MTGQIYVSRDGAEEQLVTQGPQGAGDINWIAAGSSYDFRLYAGLDHKQMLARVIVRGVRSER
jgi:hypothetical protein